MKLKINVKGKAFVISLAAVISAVSGMIIQRTQEPQIYYNGSEFREAVDLEMRVDKAAEKITAPPTDISENAPEDIDAASGVNMAEDVNTASGVDTAEDVNTASGADTAETKEINESNPDENLININTASAEELMSLDGIGEKLSQRIIDYRTENGGFNTIQDIMKVSGIGNKKFAAVKDKITV